MNDSIQVITETGIPTRMLYDFVQRSLESVAQPLGKVLLIPPDITRQHSGVGEITCEYFRLLSKQGSVDVLPALGTHAPMTESEAAVMFPGIPFDRFLHHSWRSGLAKLGEVDGNWMAQHSNEFLTESVSVEINCALASGYDLIISIGQVVPHEVSGMANYSKNIVVGCGGKSMIDSSHMLGAAYGIEKILGTIENPVRALFDHVQQEFLAGLPILYFLTVSAGTGSEHKTVGAFAGSSRKVFEAAALLSRQVNIIEIPERVKKAIVFLDHKRFKSTWLGNKAIYRTRMMLADDAELLVLAPGVKLFGEDRENDVLIRKYGYAGRQQVFTWLKTQADLRNNLSVAAHLIHGSSEGRFKITYAVDHLTRQEIEKVGFSHAELSRIRHLYPVDQWQDGFRTLSDGTEAYFISNPATALWVASRQTSEAERVDV